MRIFGLGLIATFLNPFSVWAQTLPDTSVQKNLLLEDTDSISVDMDGVEVLSTRAGEAPFATATLDKENLRKFNTGVDIPFLLDQTPSTVVTSDAGAGIGYSGIRIRGSDATRINLTINGVPINDAESQSVYWVNMPDLASSTESIEIQRGAGASTNGAGAFGGTINIRTNRVETAAYGELNNSYGSFNSRKHSALFGTGLLGGRWILEGRLSQIASDGYIDRATSNLKSYSFTGTYTHKLTLIRFNTFSGAERTYQAWGGVPIQYIDTLRTYNPYSYQNEVDNYRQTHYQLHINQAFAKYWTANLSLHYTKGGGYYEQYKTQEKFSKYNLPNLILGDTTITRTDLIRRRWLDNDFYGLVYSLNYQKGKLAATFGGGANQYAGKHFGEVIWAAFAQNSPNGYKYYDNIAHKTDINTFLKATYAFTSKLSAYADIQYRFVGYDFLGYDNQLRNVTQKANLNFINPKAGLTFSPSANTQIYGSFSTARREPNRDDYTQSSPQSRPRAENLYDSELGYKQLFGENFSILANAYYMYYIDQLVLTGKLNDVGAAIRTNVPKSYRAGLELQANLKLTKRLTISSNATLSQNKILNFSEFVDNWDTGAQENFEYKNVDIAFSPKLISTTNFGWRLVESDRQGFDLNLQTKYVGKQYLDNTQSAERALAGYWTSDLLARYQLKNTFLGIKNLSLTFSIRNLFNAHYSSNGWTYRFRSDSYNPTPDDPYVSANTQTAGFYQQIGLYPQAGRNFMVGLNIRF